MDEQRPLRSMVSDIPPIPMPTMDTTMAPSDQFSIDALAFLSSSFDTYPISGYLIRTSHFPHALTSFSSPTPTQTVLLGADCIPSSDVPLIFVQEPTVITSDDLAMQMDTLPPLDQVLHKLFSTFLINQLTSSVLAITYRSTCSSGNRCSSSRCCHDIGG